MRWLSILLIAALACQSPEGLAVRGARRFQPLPDAQLDSLDRVLDACSGLPGSWRRVRFYAVDAMGIDDPGVGAVAGIWISPHTIYLADSIQGLEVGVVGQGLTPSQRWAELVAHELLHDRLGVPGHPPVFTICGLAPTGGY